MSGRGWRSPRGGPRGAEGVKTVCAHFRDPYLSVRVQHRRATVPPQAVLSLQPPTPHPPLSSQPHPSPPPATGGCRGRAQGRAGRWWGAPSDFKDIDRHFSIVQKPRNSSDGPPRPPNPPNCNPSTVILFNISSSRRPPKSLSEERSL